MNKQNDNNQVPKPQRKWTYFLKKPYWPFNGHIKTYDVWGKT
jgi:hypothetical protein